MTRDNFVRNIQCFEKLLLACLWSLYREINKNSLNISYISDLLRIYWICVLNYDFDGLRMVF